MPKNAYAPGYAADAQYDAGLRSYLLRVYGLVAGGLAVSGAVAMTIASTPLGQAFYTVHGRHMSLTGLGLLAELAPLALILLAFFARGSRSKAVVGAIYWPFTACFGVGLSALLGRYGYAGMALPLLVTCSAFSGLCIYGYTTRRDLAGVGSFCVMGLFGLVIAGFASAIFGLGISQLMLSVVSVIVFTGLTAWDAQKIKADYLQSGDDSVGAATWAAMDLYLDFINLLFSITRILNNGRDD